MRTRYFSSRFQKVIPPLFFILMLLASCTPYRISDKMPDHVFQQMNVEDLALQRVQDEITANQILDSSTELPRWSELRPALSPGDRLHIRVHNGDDFSGIYEVDIDGAVNIPYLPSQHVAGHDVSYAETLIATALVESGQFRPSRVWVSVRVQQWASIQVNVGGAVFNSGIVTINVRDAEERTQKSTQYSGDFPPERLLPAALRSAGGVRPDAAIDTITLIRNGVSRIVDLSGVTDGRPIPAIPLMTGDTIVVPTSGKMDRKLLVPSIITAPGIRVFLSNLTVPSRSNATSAIGKESTSLPYGSRLITAMTAANCFGGTVSTNAARYGVLVRKNPLNGKQEVETRSIKELLMNPDNDDINVFLMPNDSVGCYDSGVTNIREIANTIFDIIVPFSLF